MTGNTHPQITLYVTSTCPFCRMAERLLDARQIPYETQNAEDPEVRAALLQSTGWRTVPVVLIGDELVGGYQELVHLDQSGRLQELLRAHDGKEQG
jgi:glutaredoxin 3